MKSEITKAAGWLMGIVGVLAMTGSSALAQTQTQTQTAQSAMAAVILDSTAYQIEGTITWTFYRGNHNDSDLTGTAMSYYTNARDDSAPTFTCSGSGPNGCTTAPATPPAPEPDAIELQQQAQADQCVFFAGGSLTNHSYKQKVVVKVNSQAPAAEQGNWTFTYTYNVLPNDPSVAPYTAWTYAQTGGTVDVGFTGFVASESFQKQSNRSKYSFTMIDGGLTRARGVMATLAGPASGSLDLNNVDTNLDMVNDALAVMPATANFDYSANGGVFGNSAVFGALHYAGGKAQNNVNDILNGVNDGLLPDNFVGNNNDLAAGNVHGAPFAGSFPGLTESGTYTITISGVLKGNSSSADFGFSVTSNTITIGACGQ
jgi:hypothetical protein